MKLSDEEIRKIMQKDVTSKTILCSEEDVELTIQKYIADGWTFVRKVEFNGRYKLTFQIVK